MNRIKVKPPSLVSRLFSVWYRHFRVYTRDMLSNAFPPFMEPIIFLFAIGIGLGVYIKELDGIPYIQFIASAMVVTPAMFTAAFECSFGTFIRLEFDKVYDGMIASPITYKDMIIGEILFAGSKGFFFSFAVLIVITVFGWGAFPRYPAALVIPFGGFLTGVMFASLSMVVTGFVKNINQFNFYFSGFLSPLFFFSGVVFPLSQLPQPLYIVAEILPLSHCIRFMRAFFLNRIEPVILLDLLYIIGFSLIATLIALKMIKPRLLL